MGRNQSSLDKDRALKRSWELWLWIYDRRPSSTFYRYRIDKLQQTRDCRLRRRIYNRSPSRRSQLFLLQDSYLSIHNWISLHPCRYHKIWKPRDLGFDSIWKSDRFHWDWNRCISAWSAKLRTLNQRRCNMVWFRTLWTICVEHQFWKKSYDFILGRHANNSWLLGLERSTLREENRNSAFGSTKLITNGFRFL